MSTIQKHWRKHAKPHKSGYCVVPETVEAAMLKPFSSPQYRKRVGDVTSGDECCLCGKDTAGQHGAIHVPVNHETGEFVTDAQAEVLGDKCSMYPIGSECAKKWSKAFPATTSSRIRWSRGAKGCGEMIVYDHQTERR